MIRTEGLTHIHLIVRDLDRALRFYREVFGLQEQFRDGPAMVFLRTPGCRDTVTLCQSGSADDRPGDNGGIAHFGFRRTDEQSLDEAVEVVVQAGGKLISRGKHPSGKTFAYVSDPDGYVIEI